MGRSPCCEKVGLKKGPWNPEEDQKLMAYIEEFGHGSWRALPAKAGLQRCGKSCRLRWTNYLRPDIKRGKFSLQEEQTIIQLHALLGNRWSAIAAQLPKRTDNEIKNYWNTHLKKRLTRMGIDPTTHKPKTDALSGSGSDEFKIYSSNLSHMAQWESSRLEAEARLVRESKLQFQQHEAHNNNNQLGSSSSTSSNQPARLVLNKITALQPLLPPCLDILKAWQSSLSNQPTKDYNNNKVMHSMCAVMLSTDDTLESPTSTLSFPGTLLPRPLPLPVSTSTTNVVGHLNENSLPLTTTTTNEPWGWGCSSLTNAEGEKRVLENINTAFNLQDDDIMMAVEAFRSAGYANISAVPPLSSNNNDIIVLEALNNDEAMVYDSSDNMEEGDMANPENSRSYWNSILGLVNDTLSGSSMF